MKIACCLSLAVLALSVQSAAPADAANNKAVAPTKLDKFFGNLANGCNDDSSTKLFEAYVDDGYPPKLTRPEGNKSIAPYLGKANFAIHEEDGYYELTVPVTNATLYGIRVSQINWYQGMENGIQGVVITFPIPLKQVKEGLARAKVKFQRVESPVDGWYEPSLQSSEKNSSHTDLACDSST